MKGFFCWALLRNTFTCTVRPRKVIVQVDISYLIQPFPSAKETVF